MQRPFAGDQPGALIAAESDFCTARKWERYCLLSEVRILSPRFSLLEAGSLLRNEGGRASFSVTACNFFFMPAFPCAYRGGMSKIIPDRVMRKTLAVIMGGGAGTRLFPLTQDRSKPAVPLAGKYRLVDIPVSNCINSGLRQIYILTQFNSTSLHQHIHASFQLGGMNPDGGFIEILAAQQTPEGSQWYQGTADAVRQNLRYFLEVPCDHYLILSGDQLYRMDYREFLDQHIASGAELTIGTVPVNRANASGFGIMHTDANRRIVRFEEKPKEAALLDQLAMPDALLAELGKRPEEGPLYQASMGIYVFNRQVLIDALDNTHIDFGKHIIPQAIERHRVHSYVFQGYWEDIGTIRAFFDANLQLTDIIPPFNFFDSQAPIYTRPRQLPASKINTASVRYTIFSDGCIVTDAFLDRCVIGIRSIIGSGSVIRESVVMGADFYEADTQRYTPLPAGTPAIGIGRNCNIRRAIIDKNARIGDGVVISPEGKPEFHDGPNYYIRDGIVVVPKNAVIPSGTWI